MRKLKLSQIEQLISKFNFLKCREWSRITKDSKCTNGDTNKIKKIPNTSPIGKRRIKIATGTRKQISKQPDNLHNYNAVSVTREPMKSNAALHCGATPHCWKILWFLQKTNDSILNCCTWLRDGAWLGGFNEAASVACTTYAAAQYRVQVWDLDDLSILGSIPTISF